jgi:hypothetical protein
VLSVRGAGHLHLGPRSRMRTSCISSPPWRLHGVMGQLYFTLSPLLNMSCIMRTRISLVTFTKINLIEHKHFAYQNYGLQVKWWLQLCIL